MYVDDLLLKRDGITNFGELISILNVKYIILTKEGDYEEYFFLFDQPDLELIKETENIYVFKNKNNVSRIYQTDDIANITDKVTVDYKEINPVKFELSDVITKKYLVFTETYSEDWKLDGVKPINVSGLVNVYESKGKEIRFERFYKINLPAYMISLTTFIILIVWYIKK